MTREAWVDRLLARHGRTRTGLLELVRDRPWSRLGRAPATHGDVWLKQPAPPFAQEVALYPLLTAADPDAVPALLGADEVHRWLLLADGGPVLGDRTAGPALVEELATAFERYAGLQRALAGDVEALLRTGAPDMRPERMPGRFDEALAAVEARTTGATEHQTLERVGALRPAFAAWCEELAASPVPASLDHNDLDATNLFASRRVFDWGDAVVAHPFASMMLGLGAISLDPGDPGVRRARDAYLAPWGDFAPLERLRADLGLACRIAKVSRALTYLRAIEARGPAEVSPAIADGPVEALASLLAPSPLGQF